MSRRHFVLPGVLLQRPIPPSGVLTVHARDPGPAFTVVRLAKRKLVRGVFTGGAHAMTVLSGFSEGDAHDVADGIWGFCAKDLGTVPEADEPLLYPLARQPKSGWDNARLLAELQSCVPDAAPGAVERMKSGHILQDHEQHYLRETLPKIVNDRRLRESLGYFIESARNCQGFMSLSFYQFHYQRERSQMTPASLAREYRQNRPRYESAFTAGFKALERLLGRSQLKRNDVGQALEELGLPSLRPSTVYTRLSEIGREHTRDITCSDLVVRFLNMRNAVGAHANRSPPPNLRISLDAVFELQHFLRHAYGVYLEPVTPFPRSTYGA
jgi:hypothetical protein